MGFRLDASYSAQGWPDVTICARFQQLHQQLIFHAKHQFACWSTPGRMGLREGNSTTNAAFPLTWGNMKSCWISCSCWEISSFRKLILEIGASSLGLPRLPQTSHICRLGSQFQWDLVRGLHCHSRSTGILQTFATSGVIRLTTPTMHYHKGNASTLPYLCIVWSPNMGNLMTPVLGTFLSFSPEFSEIWANTPASSGWDPYPNGGHLYWTLFKGHGNKPGRTWHFPGISLLFPHQSEFFFQNFCPTSDMASSQVENSCCFFSSCVSQLGSAKWKTASWLQICTCFQFIVWMHRKHHTQCLHIWIHYKYTTG